MQRRKSNIQSQYGSAQCTSTRQPGFNYRVGQLKICSAIGALHLQWLVWFLCSQAFGFSVRPGRRWRGSNPGSLATVPPTPRLTVVFATIVMNESTQKQLK
ncbi:hypothetical protein PoB_000867200 [Plakobranchus ocellatus]|uniref:Uncharacterized protein n=1 Tax=Plakobranchus ocellatus TaxID=259542 RepID=A0AAV3YIG8_9GAST|nr:hypothetical protein PoB_000867200 [Plakobranchus ocellatus]